MNVHDVNAWIDTTADDLQRLGLKRGHVVLVHSSLSRLGHVPGGAESVVCALLAVLGREGTLAMPALSYRHVHADQPVFDLRNTPSCVGAIPEHFRRRAGTMRSAHPTHSACAVGAQSEYLLGVHHRDDTPCGPHSPYVRLRDCAGKLLMLGCGLGPNTSMHAVEEAAAVPYVFSPGWVAYELIDGQGQRRAFPSRRHNHSERGWRQRYDRLETLLPEHAHCRGSVQQASADLLHVPAMWDCALKQLEHDPYYFVDSRLC